ncbi:MAG: ISNCY family transposase [Balneolaceae bacterium]
MRKRFEAQLSLGCTPIDQVEIPTKTRAHIAALMQALQYIYTHPEWNRRIFDLLSEKITAGKKQTGRRGMSLWEMFVLGQVRLCLNISYDELHYRANYDSLLRGILGVLPTDFSVGKLYEYQNIYDNVKLLDESLLREINDIIVEAGHQVFKKKETDALRLKTDSFVVETDVHFPTDYRLLWDSARKCIDIAENLSIPGWRKSNHWKRSLKGLMRVVGKTSAGGGANKTKRVRTATSAYLSKARALEKKVGYARQNAIPGHAVDLARLVQLDYYHQMLVKHIELVERRLIKGEKIPHSEKVFSIFLPWTELIKKGKRNPSVEFGKSLAVTSDQYHLMVDWQLAEGQSDNELTLPVAERLKEKYTIQSLSVDKGFSDMADKAELEAWIPQVIMPKKGKRSQSEKALESAPAFKKLKNKHSAVESNINELEHRGLDRCPDRTRENFTRYVGLAITAYNLHKIGRELLRHRRTQVQCQKAA